MGTATNVDATAVNTIEWLSAPDTTIVVPVYQRQYRWDIGGCEQLLGDVRAVAAGDSGHTHFIGSILSTASTTTSDDAHLVLIDGQQRITTLMLLVAALHHTLIEDDPELARELETVLVRGDDDRRTKLRPHRAWADVFESVVLDRRGAEDAARESRFDDNYAFFRSQIRPGEAASIWRGLQRLEHVSITLRAQANAQQIFESLNSTGEPLRDHELIHNYVLMGLTHDQQAEVESEFWIPIEEATGDAIGAFWNHYLVMRTGREVLITGERGVYDVFRTEFPRLDVTTLREVAAQWLEYARIYRELLDPSGSADSDLVPHLHELAVLGRGMSPLIMRLVSDRRRGILTFAQLVSSLRDIQSLVLRRTVAGISTERLVARLVRAYAAGEDDLTRAIARITPSDERTRVGLKYTDLPFPRYVLGRLGGVTLTETFEVAPVFPVGAGDDWSGDGVRRFADYGEDAQNSLRALAHTIGNLALLEPELADRALDATYPRLQPLLERSAISLSRDTAAATVWDTAAISARAEALAARFVTQWGRPDVTGIDDDDLTPILDAKRRRGWPRGWQREFDYVEFRGEHWEVPDVRYLFNRIFRRVWTDSRQSLLDFTARRGGPVYPAQAWNGPWDELADGHHLYMGWDSRYMLTAVQDVLDEAGWAPEVFVKYSYIGEAMR